MQQVDSGCCRRDQNSTSFILVLIFCSTISSTRRQESWGIPKSIAWEAIYGNAVRVLKLLLSHLYHRHIGMRPLSHRPLIYLSPFEQTHWINYDCSWSLSSVPPFSASGWRICATFLCDHCIAFFLLVIDVRRCCGEEREHRMRPLMLLHVPVLLMEFVQYPWITTLSATLSQGCVGSYSLLLLLRYRLWLCNISFL